MAVPDTNTFSLQDVVDELNHDDYPTNAVPDDSHEPVTRLDEVTSGGAFKVAIENYPGGFNANYAQEGFRMSEFRDFDKTRGVTTYGVTGGQWGDFNPYAGSTQSGYVFPSTTRAVTVPVRLVSIPTDAGTDGVSFSAAIIQDDRGMVSSLSPTSFTGTNPTGSTQFTITLTVNENGNLSDTTQPERSCTIRYTYPGGTTNVNVTQYAGDDSGQPIP